MSVPSRVILRGMFGKPTLQWLKNDGTESNGRAEWSRDWRRYGQWTAKLSPGIQTDDDYGSVSWDVNGMRLADLQQISYVYRMGATELVAPNVAIHVYDPADIDNRADITLSHTTVGLGVTSGWQKYDLTTAIDGCFYYGNNIPSTTGLASHDGTSTTIYTLAQFQADPVFSTYVIGKITIEYGYYSAGLLTPAHICKVEVRHSGNIVDLELVPSLEEQLFDKLPVLKEIRTAVDIGSTDCALFAAGDIMGNDDCCTTTAVAWTFANVARNLGGHGRIIGATLVSDMEDLAIQWDLLLFNTTPTNTLLSNSANDNPQKEDISLFLGTIVFPQSTARGADVATYTQATPASTSTNIPMPFKCAATDDNLYGVLVTRTSYTHTDNDTIEITLLVEQW